MYSINTLRAVNHNMRVFSSSAAVCTKNHYDSLGITPNATQADVKGAYYKLSKIYHPDKNEGSGTAADKFRDITAAYEVLGNVRLRKLYDKGVSHIGGRTPDDPVAKFYKSREQRSRPPSTGRTPIYDFDEWSKSHYGATFARNMERKREAQFYKTVVDNETRDQKIALTALVLGVLAAILIYFSAGPLDQDVVTYTRSNNSITYPESKK